MGLPAAASPVALRLLPGHLHAAGSAASGGLRVIPRRLYDALLDEAAASLRTLEADPRFVGCHVAGFFGVLHTWGRQLQYHPHAHFVIPGGGLSEDRTQWIAARGDFLVHVRALSRLFRGKLRARLKALGLLAEVPLRGLEAGLGRALPSGGRRTRP